MTIRHIAARQHPRLFYSDIFTPISAGRRKKAVEWIREFEDVTVTIRMFNQLDVADQDLMLCILSIARSHVNTMDQKEYLVNPARTPEGLKSELKGYKPSQRAKLSIERLPTLNIKTTCNELLTDIGRSTGGSDYKWLISSLKRLSSTSFFLENKKEIFGGSNMLSFNMDKDTNEVSIHINALSAHSIWAPFGDYIYSDRRERHTLDSDLARALHDKLCARVRAGEKNRRLKADELLSLIYNDSRDVKKAESEDKDTVKKRLSKRRGQLMVAIKQVNKLPLWNIETDGRGAKLALVVSRKKTRTAKS
ncbi:replication protein C, IncQ-type [Vibrio fortis]|nr:replication protein C, IncQ-type [Vibrio fortis]